MGNQSWATEWYGCFINSTVCCSYWDHIERLNLETSVCDVKYMQISKQQQSNQLPIDQIKSCPTFFFFVQEAYLTEGKKKIIAISISSWL